VADEPVKNNQTLYIPSLLTFLFIFGSFTAVAFGGKDPGAIGIVFGHQASYSKVVSVLKPALETAGFRCILAELPKPETKTPSDNVLQSLLDAKPRLIVAVGIQATCLALEKGGAIPVVFCMVPNALDTPFMAKSFKDQKRLAGLTTDVSPRDQMAWILKLHPGCKTLGVLHSSRSRCTAQAIKQAGEAVRVKVVMIETDKEKFPEAIKSLTQQDCDGVLMLPDALVYNPINVRELLLWGLRQKKPVWGFSANIVKAGAFSGQFFNPEAVGTRMAEVVQKAVKDSQVSKIGLQYAAPVQTAINLRTMEMIGLSIDERIRKTINLTYGKE
jgi:ABC-type uncharacterized transport system substrate-binding protein